MLKICRECKQIVDVISGMNNCPYIECSGDLESLDPGKLTNEIYNWLRLPYIGLEAWAVEHDISVILNTEGSASGFFNRCIASNSVDITISVTGIKIDKELEEFVDFKDTESRGIEIKTVRSMLIIRLKKTLVDDDKSPNKYLKIVKELSKELSEFFNFAVNFCYSLDDVLELGHTKEETDG